MLKLLEDRNDPLGERRSDLASLAEDGFELGLGDVVEVDLEESISEGSREDLSTSVKSWRVLGGEEHEVRVGTNDFLGFGDDQLSVVVEESIESLENVGGSQVQLVENDPVSSSNGSDENSLLEDELSGIGIRDVGSEVLLDVGVLVVVDPDEAMSCSTSEVLNGTGLSARRRSLDEDWEPVAGDDSSEIDEFGLNRGSEDVIGSFVDLLGTSLKPERSESNEVVFRLPCWHPWHLSEDGPRVPGSSEDVLLRESSNDGCTLHVQEHGEGHEESLPERTTKTVDGGNVGCEGEGSSEGSHRVVGRVVGSIGEFSSLGERLGGEVELCDVEDGWTIRDGDVSDVLGDDGEESFSIRVGGGNVDLGEPGSKTGREILLSDVRSGVHAGEESEVGVSDDGFEISSLGEDD